MRTSAAGSTKQRVYDATGDAVSPLTSGASSSAYPHFARRRSCHDASDYAAHAPRLGQTSYPRRGGSRPAATDAAAEDANTARHMPLPTASLTSARLAWTVTNPTCLT